MVQTKINQFMELTYYGHSCFLVKINNERILFDPFIRPNELAKGIDIDEIKADYVVISHAHEDHTADAEYILKNTDAKLISNWEIVTYYQKLGIKNVHPMNIGGQWVFRFGALKMVEAVHSSSFPDGTYGGSAAGFIITTDTANFYYSGDTALHLSMRLIGDFHNIDFAILPIGDNFTMNISEALIASDYVQTDKIIPVHYDTFPFINVSKQESLVMAKESNKELLFLEIGETISIN